MLVFVLDDLILQVFKILLHSYNVLKQKRNTPVQVNLFQVSRHKFFGRAGSFVSDLIGNPKDRFFH